MNDTTRNDTLAPISYEAEPYRIKAVEPIKRLTVEQRKGAIEQAGYNPVLLKSEDVYLDFFTDSGTGAMSDRQWAALMMGDEAYAGSRNFYRLENTVRRYYGYRHVVPAHQGRGAENIMSKMLIKQGDFVPGNMYFPSTRLHQELAGGTFVDIIVDEAHDAQAPGLFKGNVDIAKLSALIERVGAERIPYISLGATVNMAGGQPISMANMRAVRTLAQQHGIRVVLDACRSVENAYFVQQREEGYASKSIAEILLEMCSLTDACTMSGKKDALVNIGGWLALNEASLYEQASNLVLVYEGLHTYGGMAGRDMEAMAVGIEESVQQEHIQARVKQVEYFGHRLAACGVPVILPVGGHAVYLDAKRFLDHVPLEEFPAQRLAVELYLASGIRSVERGTLSAGRNVTTGEPNRPTLELVRLAIPRRVYTQSHFDFAVEAIASVHRRRKELRGLRLTHEPKFLRFFQARFELL
ncbi:tyrosine phenol-lyase [Pendulispora rubella]|uniref:Tyrosine phenol-lyase n=1 Tax=Pendulispora rubella TaxID=2741070 RepID=A0ABZ2L2B3_9BACT